jgi:S-adenosylmethionine decarboxylase
MSATDMVLGRHWFLDMSDCSGLPHTPEDLDRILCESVLLSGATIVHKCFHTFSPIGLTGVVIIAESHVAVHTWPEHNAICVDYFSCSERLDVQKTLDALIREFKPAITKQSVRGRRVTPR